MTREEQFAWALGIRGEKANWTFNSAPVGIAAGIEFLKQWAIDSKPLGVLLCGTPGTGKSGLLVGTIKARACQWLTEKTGQSGEPPDQQAFRIATNEHVVAAQQAGTLRRKPEGVWYEDWQSLLQRIRHAASASDPEARVTEYEMLDELDRCDTVAFDDADLGTMTEYREALLKTLVERPEYGKRVLLAANVPSVRFVDVFGERITDRLRAKRHWKVIEFTGASLRS